MQRESNFLTDIKNSKRLEEIIIVLFRFISLGSGKSVRKQYFAETQSGNTVFSESNGIIQLLLSMLPYNLFSDWTHTIMRLFQKTNIDKWEILCYDLLLKIDDAISWIISRKSYLITPCSYEMGEYVCVLKPRKIFWENEFQKYKIRRGRQTMAFQRDGIISELKNYGVFKSSYFMDYHPIIKYGFNSPNYIFDNVLKIAIVPLSNETWYDYHENDKDHTFAIDTQFKDLDHVEKMKRILLKAEKEEYNIIVFPELAIEEKTKEELGQFVLDNNFDHVKLFFFGSCWNNNENVALLFNNQGTLLLSNKKKSRFSYYNKAKQICFSEDIKEEKEIQFVDIPGLGRIVYLICADALEHGIFSTYSVLNTDFVFISALTNNTNKMITQAKSNADNYAITTIISNSCAQLQEHDGLAAYVCTVDFRDKEVMSHTICEERTCKKGQLCAFCIKSAYIVKR